MTEEQWLAYEGPGEMILYLQGRGSERKLRLFACACCRYLWESLKSKRSRRAVEAAERYAEGLIPRAEMRRAAWAASAAFKAAGGRAPEAAAEGVARAAAGTDAWGAAVHASGWASQAGLRGGIQPKILRCIFGNPFRPVVVDPAWRTPHVLALARTIYDEKCFDDLPILADALEEAGCTDAETLAHCRGLGPHVRGCWVVDFILGKT